MRKGIMRIILLGIAVMLAMPLFAGGGRQATSDTIRLGYVGALTGDTAHWGQAGLNGMILAAEMVNAAGGVLGKQIEIFGLDGRGDPQDSVNALNRLLDVHNVVGVLGTNFSSCNIPMAPIATARRVPLVATAATNDLVTVDANGNLHPFSFRLTFVDSFQGRKMAEYVYDRRNARTAAIIINQADSYSTGISVHAIAGFTEKGGTIVVNESAQSGDRDFRAQLTRVVHANPDVLFIPWVFNDVALIGRQARELGYRGLIAGFDGFDSPQLPALAEGALEGAIYSSRAGFALPDAQAFADRYRARFNIDVETEILFGYDGLMWFVQAINEAGSYEPVAIRDRLAGTTHFSGLLGTMSIDRATHNPQRDLGIFQVRGNDNVFVELYR